MNTALKTGKLPISMNQFIPLAHCVLIKELPITIVIIQVFNNIFGIIGYRHTLICFALIDNENRVLFHAIDSKFCAYH